VNGMLKSLEKKGFIERKTGVARSIDILIDRAQIPRWTKKIAATFTFWAPNNASQEMLDEIAEKVIAARKAT
jgi:DNA-binding MarR family transcriptional regulator